MMRFRPPAGLRTKALILVGATLAVLLAVETYHAAANRRASVAEATARVERIADRLVAQQNAAMRFAREVGHLVETTDLASAVRTQGCPDSFERIVREEPRIANVVLLDPGGFILCVGTGSAEGVNVADRSYFRRALASHEWVVDEAILGRASGKWAIPFAKALRHPGGSVTAVFLVMLDVAWIKAELVRSQLPPGARAGVIDHSGRVLARFPDPDGWSGRDASATPFFRDLVSRGGQGTGSASGFDGVRRLYAFARFAETAAGPVHLWVGVDENEITAGADREFYAALGVALLLSLVAFGVIWWGGARLLRPLGVICEAAHRLAGGDYSVRTGMRHGRDEIGSLARSFDAMAQELEKRARLLEAANAELEAFAYSVSHDLRAPLRAIDGFSQAVLEDYRDKLDAQGEQYLNRLRAAAQRMGQLIDDMLRLSRVTRMEMKLEPVDLALAAQDIVGALRRASPERGVQVRIAPGLAAWGDAALLRIVLDNLLDNAWKFTARTPGAFIELGEEGAGAERRFYVRDNGAGFDMAYAGKLFGAFQRLHSAAEFPGTGIGLATVKRVINRHGGRVWAESAPGHGAIFYFTLPARGMEAGNGQHPEHSSSRGQPGRRGADAPRAAEEQYP